MTLRMTTLARSVRLCRWWNMLAQAKRYTSFTNTSNTIGIAAPGAAATRLMATSTAGANNRQRCAVGYGEYTHAKRREHMFTVVRITDLESDSLQELRAESSREGFRFIERLCEEWASGTNRFNAPGEALFVAVANGQVVGICGLNRDPYACDPRIGRVRRLYVAPAQRRHGVGRALLETVVTHARRHFRLLRVRSEAASEFYATQGFRRVASSEEVTHVLEFNSAA